MNLALMIATWVGVGLSFFALFQNQQRLEEQLVIISQRLEERLMTIDRTFLEKVKELSQTIVTRPECGPSDHSDRIVFQSYDPNIEPLSGVIPFDLAKQAKKGSLKITNAKIEIRVDSRPSGGSVKLFLNRNESLGLRQEQIPKHNHAYVVDMTKNIKSQANELRIDGNLVRGLSITYSYEYVPAGC